MNYKVETTPNFEKEAELLIRKYPSLKLEIQALIDELEINPQKGKSLGNGVYKIRIAIKSKGKGKRGGGRIMTQVKFKRRYVYLFSIYNKGEKDDLSDDEIRNLIKEIPD